MKGVTQISAKSADDIVILMTQAELNYIRARRLLVKKANAEGRKDVAVMNLALINEVLTDVLLRADLL